MSVMPPRATIQGISPNCREVPKADIPTLSMQREIISLRSAQPPGDEFGLPLRDAFSNLLGKIDRMCPNQIRGKVIAVKLCQ